MLTDFRKIVTDDGDLTEVQQNVFDSFRELQVTDFCNLQSFGRQDGLANNTQTVITSPFTLPSGDFICEIGVAIEVVYSVVPTSAVASIGIGAANNNPANVVSLFPETLALGASPLRIFLRREFVFETTGGLFQLKAQINAVGGTVTSRNVALSYIKTFRRFI